MADRKLHLRIGDPPGQPACGAGLRLKGRAARTTRTTTDPDKVTCAACERFLNQRMANR